ncbi:MAG TPA: potassium channel family protein [Allocoleopsis sp.]
MISINLLREKIAFYLEDIETPIGKAINLLITGFVLLSSAIFVAETYPLPDYVRINLNTIDFLILLLFAYEYLLRFWCTTNKIKYLFSLYSIIDLLVIIPFFLGAVDISFLRIFRWFRILRLIRFIEGKKIFGKISSEDGVISTRIIFTLFAIIFVYSGLIYQVEHPVNPKIFATFFDAVYFSVVTMTTVGFGDVTPISQGGRLMTVLMILTGIALIPWQLGDLIKRLVKSGNQINIICENCRLSSHDLDAKFCKSCGSKLEKIADG